MAAFYLCRVCKRRHFDAGDAELCEAECADGLDTLRFDLDDDEDMEQARDYDDYVSSLYPDPCECELCVYGENPDEPPVSDDAGYDYDDDSYDW